MNPCAFLEFFKKIFADGGKNSYVLQFQIPQREVLFILVYLEDIS